MTCITIGNGIMCGFLPTISYKGYLFEWHAVCGPMEMEKLFEEDFGEYYEPTNKLSTDAFYTAAQEWHSLPEAERETYRLEVK